MRGVKEAILLAREQRLSLKKDLSQIKSALKATRFKKTISYLLLYGLIKKSIPENLSKDIVAQTEAIQQTKERINESFVELEVNFDSEIQQKYHAMVAAFGELSKSQKIWDVTSAHYEDRVVSRSSASTVVTRRRVRFAMRSIPEFRSEVQALYFQNANGADLYVYPSFAVMYSRSGNFAIIGLDELHLQQNYVRFTETESVPLDAKVVDRTWAKVNKNGSPDRRFKSNYQIPIVRYGEIRLKSDTGLNEEYEFSNYEATEVFGRAFQAYRQAVISGSLGGL